MRNSLNALALGSALAAGAAQAEVQLPLVPMEPAERDMGFESYRGDALDEARSIISEDARKVSLVGVANTRVSIDGSCPGIEYGNWKLTSRSQNVVKGAPVAVMMDPTFSRVGENGTFSLASVLPSKPGSKGKYELACVQIAGEVNPKTKKDERTITDVEPLDLELQALAKGESISTASTSEGDGYQGPIPLNSSFWGGESKPYGRAGFFMPFSEDELNIGAVAGVGATLPGTDDLFAAELNLAVFKKTDNVETNDGNKDIQRTRENLTLGVVANPVIVQDFLRARLSVAAGLAHVNDNHVDGGRVPSETSGQIHLGAGVELGRVGGVNVGAEVMYAEDSTNPALEGWNAAMTLKYQPK